VTLTVAMDTATDVASIAVGRDGALLVEVALPGRRHAAALLPGVVAALEMAGATLGDVRRVLTCDGPGSFTGLRIGLATAQGIARGNDAVTVGTLPSLAALAWAAAPLTEGPIAAVYDALRGDVFGAVYQFDPGGVRALVAPALLPLEELIRRAAPPPRLVVGDGGVLPAEQVRAWSGRAPVPMPAVTPRAAAMIALDGVPGGVRDISDVFSFEPDYGRPAEAQTRWEHAHGRPMPDSGGEFR